MYHTASIVCSIVCVVCACGVCLYCDTQVCVHECVYRGIYVYCDSVCMYYIL